MTGRPRRPPRLYFSFRSPYSWLTLRRLRRSVSAALDGFDVVPYWDPDARTSRELAQAGGQFHYVQMSRAKHLYILMDTKRLARAEGAPMAWPVDVDPHWERPHLGWLHARAAGHGWRFYDQVIEARWRRGENVCEADVLARCAERAGLDADLVTTAHLEGAVRKEGVDCLYQAYLDDVFAVPYVRWGQHRFWGLDRVDAFLRVWRADGRVPADAAPPSLEQAYDVDQSGGCG
jgi:2-hydroxychromene-2-carboxylate isomerase